MNDKTSDTKPDDAEAIEFAWKVHAALDSWTGKVDTKASIVLAIESALFGFTVAQTKTGARFADLKGCEQTLYGFGFGLLLAAVLLALAVVFPQLKGRDAKKSWRKNMIYFGHLRYWEPTELAKALRHERPVLDQLAQQLVKMGQIAWRKHRLLQGSLVMVALAVVCLVVAA